MIYLVSTGIDKRLESKVSLPYKVENLLSTSFHLCFCKF